MWRVGGRQEGRDNFGLDQEIGLSQLFTHSPTPAQYFNQLFCQSIPIVHTYHLNVTFDPSGVMHLIMEQIKPHMNVFWPEIASQMQ